MHVELAGYHVRDIEFSAAFDVDRNKVGKDLADAVFAEPNNTFGFTEVPPLGVEVRRGPTHDGLGKYLRERVEEAPDEPADVAAVLRRTHTDVLVAYLPVGAEAATKWYAAQAIEAGCAFVNCIPVFIASDPAWARRPPPAGCSRGCSATEAYAWIAPTSSTSAAIPTSSTCWNASGCPPRRFRKRTRSRASSGSRSIPPTCTWGRATTCRGSRIANGVTSTWKARRSATCRSSASSSWKCGTRRTRPAS